MRGKVRGEGGTLMYHTAPGYVTQSCVPELQCGSEGGSSRCCAPRSIAPYRFRKQTWKST